MSEETLHERLAGFFRYRAVEDFGLPAATPELLASFLTEECALDDQDAFALAAGEPLALDGEDLARVALVFHLSPELLSCLMHPVSNEVLVHTLNEVAGGQFNSDGCPVCLELEERLAAADTRDEPEELLELCFELLDHLVFSAPGTAAAPYEAEELFDEHAAQRAMAPASALDDVLAQLDNGARQRVLAYAYQELARTTDGRDAATFAAYAHLRSAHLPPLARQACDALSQAPEGVLTAEEVAASLNLANPHSVQELQTCVQSAVASLARDGLSVPEMPVVVTGAGQTLCLRMTAQARTAWRALLRAERSGFQL